jgi:hypothetical protein
MAANQLRTARAHIGLTNGEDDNVVNVVQGTESVRELGCCLKDEGDIDLCKTIHGPGRHLSNPELMAGGAMNSVTPHVGVVVSQRAETNVRCSWLLALRAIATAGRISARATNISTMNLTSIRCLCGLKSKDDLHETDPPSAPTIDLRNWPKMMSALQDCFSRVPVRTEAPLAWVVATWQQVMTCQPARVIGARFGRPWQRPAEMA